MKCVAQTFSQVVIRKNIIRDVQGGSGIVSSLSGINVSNCGQHIAENNIISNAGTDKAVRFTNCTSKKFFNIQDQAGKLLRGYDGTNYVQELEDEVQDVLLPL